MLALLRAVVLEFWSAVMVQAVPTSGGFRGATNARTDGNRIVQDLSFRISVKQALHRFFISLGAVLVWFPRVKRSRYLHLPTTVRGQRKQCLLCTFSHVTTLIS